MLYPRDDLHANHLLGALSEEDWRSLEPHLELVRVKSPQLLCDADEPIRHMYFPTTAVMSMLYLMEDGATVEVAAIGNEGVVGVPVLTGGGTMPSRVEVRSSGFAYRVPASVFRKEFEKSMGIHRLMLLYIQALMTQIAQSALCNRHHSVNEQLCRWLLLAHDRLTTDELAVTQQMIANMLGVRREGVTEAAGKLQEAGLIRQRRGHITVLDRHGLEARACECYSMIRREFDRLLPRAADVVALERSRTIAPAEGRALRTLGYVRVLQPA
jgi:CRP-like cAMP-binding protein